MGSRVIKKVKEKEYLYYSYYDNGKKISRYCGLACEPNSQVNANKFEIEDLEKQLTLIQARLKKVKKE